MCCLASFVRRSLLNDLCKTTHVTQQNCKKKKKRLSIKYKLFKYQQFLFNMSTSISYNYSLGIKQSTYLIHLCMTTNLNNKPNNFTGLTPKICKQIEMLFSRWTFVTGFDSVSIHNKKLHNLALSACACLLRIVIK